MQLVIDIDEEDYKRAVAISKTQHWRSKLTIEQTIRCGTPLPKNATNGDMFKALFPNYIYVGTCVLDKNECILLHDVNYHWWNAPYKEGREE